MGAAVGAATGAYFTGESLSAENERLKYQVSKEKSRNLEEKKQNLKQPPPLRPDLVDQVTQTISSLSLLLEGHQDPTSSSASTKRQAITNQFDPARDSGTYRGETEESDGTSQKVESELRFLEDVKIEGDGFDDEDGPYKTNGAWSGDKATWKEQYGNYWVQVDCTRCQSGLGGDDSNNNNSFLRCKFVSSIDNINGKFYLQKKDKSTFPIRWIDTK